MEGLGSNLRWLWAWSAGVGIALGHGRPFPAVEIESTSADVGRLALTQLQQAAADTPCVLGAVLDLEGRCNVLSEEERGRLALQLANCHWELSGWAQYPCKPSEPLHQCTAQMQSADFGVFTSFKIKVDEVCRYLSLEATQLLAQQATDAMFQATSHISSNVSTLGNKLQNVSSALEVSMHRLLRKLPLQDSIDYCAAKCSIHRWYCCTPSS